MTLASRSAARRTRPSTEFGPASNGMSMTPEEFDRGTFEPGWQYELVRGVLIVSPPALEEERDPNEQLGHWLRTYQESNPRGRALDKTLSEHTIITGQNRRRADRVIWAGLGRRPRRKETPTIVVEFVSRERRDRIRDYKEKRDEYLGIGVKEYWVFDRFDGTMTVFLSGRNEPKARTYRRTQTYKSPLLPGYLLKLEPLFALIDEWADDPSTDPD